jgi:hypothetical protein
VGGSSLPSTPTTEIRDIDIDATAFWYSKIYILLLDYAEYFYVTLPQDIGPVAAGSK